MDLLHDSHYQDAGQRNVYYVTHQLQDLTRAHKHKHQENSRVRQKPEKPAIKVLGLVTMLFIHKICISSVNSLMS